MCSFFFEQDRGLPNRRQHLLQGLCGLQLERSAWAGRITRWAADMGAESWGQNRKNGGRGGAGC
jgi:hypothetical protein